MFQTAFTDCDQDLSPVDTIFKNNDIVYTLYQCKTAEEVIEKCQGYEVLMNQYAPLTEKVFSGLPNLKVVVRNGVGVDHIDVAAASRHGVTICNVPDGSTQEVADHAMALLLALARKIVFLNSSVRAGRWSFEDAKPMLRLNKSTLGLVGAGRIGCAVAERARSFGMKILAHDEYTLKYGVVPPYIEMTSLDDILKRSDFISVHCPLDGNRNLFNRDTLGKMKPGASLVNVSRGGIVDEEALFATLSSGALAGAAMDVSEKEPISPASLLLTLDNYIQTPHMAYYSIAAAEDIAVKLAEEVARFFKKEPLRCPVN